MLNTDVYKLKGVSQRYFHMHCVLFYLAHQHHLQLDDLASNSLSILSHILLIGPSYISPTSLNPLLLVSEMIVVVVDFVLACSKNRFYASVVIGVECSVAVWSPLEKIQKLLRKQNKRRFLTSLLNGLSTQV